jgi:hypothetical protein
MCTEMEIVLRKTILKDSDFELAKTIFSKYEFAGTFISYNELMTQDKDNKDAYNNMNEELKIAYNKAIEGFDNTENNNYEYSDIQKNSIAINIDSYKENCLCPLNNSDIIISLLKDLKENFDEVYYQPYCFTFIGSDSLDATVKKEISIEDENYNFIPSMSFRPMVKII